MFNEMSNQANIFYWLQYQHHWSLNTFTQALLIQSTLYSVNTSHLLFYSMLIFLPIYDGQMPFALQ